MKIVILNATDQDGGAAIAAQRIGSLYRMAGHQVNFLCLKKNKGSVQNSTPIINSKLAKLKYGLFTKLEELVVKQFTNHQEFNYSTGLIGHSIIHHPLIREADVLHLHWVNHTFLSIKEIGKLFETEKKIIWTLHDMWAFTGGCHHSRGCTNFILNCENCHLLKHPDSQILSKFILEKKLAYFKKKGRLTLVTPSNWLKDLGIQSKLFNNCDFRVIPNPLDTQLFKPSVTSSKTNSKFTILFGAANALTNKRKGIDYLINALSLLINQNPNLKEIVELRIFGTKNENNIDIFPIETILLGDIYDTNQLVKEYQYADCFILPSLEENLPNTIMESLACGTPVVSFDCGGIKDMVETKQTGYLAKYKDIEDLANGILTIYNNGKKSYETECRNRAVEMASFDTVSSKYNSLIE
jgi:glycosyltransferase involved in cell wall biosynthesis